MVVMAPFGNIQLMDILNCVVDYLIIDTHMTVDAHFIVFWSIFFYDYSIMMDHWDIFVCI